MSRWDFREKEKIEVETENKRKAGVSEQKGCNCEDVGIIVKAEVVIVKKSGVKVKKAGGDCEESKS